MFKLSIDKNYYKPILVKSGYNVNYIQYESKGDKTLTLKKYLALIEKYLRKLTNYYKNKGEWKVQLIADISFISLKPSSDETRIMHTRSDNEKFMNGSDTDEIIKGLFESFLQKYEENLQEKMKGSDFEFDGVNFLYYDFNKISINRGGSYIDSPKWLKDKKSTINPINNDCKCFQYTVTLALNLKKLVYVPHNTRKMHVAYKSKQNLTRENQIILLMITDGEKWHYLTAKNLSGLLRGITSNHAGDFYCLNCFCAYSTKNKFEAH